MQTRVIILLVFSLLIATFAVMNIQPVVIDFYFTQTNIPLIFLIIFSVLFGALFMFVLSSMKHIQLNRLNKQLKKENQELQEQLEQFKPKADLIETEGLIIDNNSETENMDNTTK